MFTKYFASSFMGWLNRRENRLMGAENFMQSAVGGKRAAKRARVLLTAKLETRTGEIDVRLRDLSRKGALLESAQLPPVGSEVVFRRGATAVSARVAWAGEGRVGLEFRDQIDEHELLVQLKRGEGERSTVNERYRRSGFGRSLSAEDRKAAKQWSVTVGLTLPEDRD